MSAAPRVEIDRAVVAGEVGDGPEITIATAAGLFAVEGVAPSERTVRGWITPGKPIGPRARVRLAARSSHKGLVTSREAVLAFKRAMDLPRGRLIDHLEDEARRRAMGADLSGDVLAELSAHGVALRGDTDHASGAAGATDAHGQRATSTAQRGAAAG